MIDFRNGRCPVCGKLALIIYSNYPLVPGTCEKCLEEHINPTDLTDVDFFCRTYNIPFNPGEWVALY